MPTTPNNKKELSQCCGAKAHFGTASNNYNVCSKCGKSFVGAKEELSDNSEEINSKLAVKEAETRIGGAEFHVFGENKPSPAIQDKWEKEFDKRVSNGDFEITKPFNKNNEVQILYGTLKSFLSSALNAQREEILRIIQTHNFMEVNIHKGVEDLIAKIKNE